MALEFDRIGISGRDRELASLQEFYEKRTSQRESALPCGILVEAESGAGKSVLVEHFLKTACPNSLSGRGKFEQNSNVSACALPPFHGFTQAVEEIVDGLLLNLYEKEGDDNDPQLRAKLIRKSAFSSDIDQQMRSICYKCPICMEQKAPYELNKLFHGCQHPSACKECLHSHYIEHAMHDISNFPLKCFWPTCSRSLRTVQLQGFAKHTDEIDRFHQKEAEAKEAKRATREDAKDKQKYELLQQRRYQNLQALQNCNSCGCATPVYPGRGETVFQCQHCETIGAIDVMTQADAKAMIRAELDEKTKE